MEDDGELRLADLYLAYRKAKADAYYDASHFDAFAFLDYEKHLHLNLKQLLTRLRGSDPWPNGNDVGTFAYMPKSVQLRAEDVTDGGVFYRCLDPDEEWRRQWSSSYRAKAKFRLVIRATVDFQVFSALWIIHAGHRYDQILNPKSSFGHRLRRIGEPTEACGGMKPLNLDCIGLFEPYFSAYQQWRGEGLREMRSQLEDGKRVFGVTMDIQSFYHRASVGFLLKANFLSRFNIALTPLQERLTRILIEGIQRWYLSTPDAEDRPSGGVPVGLSASKIIANVLLAELDEQMLSRLEPFYYGRYVDDIFLVFEGDTSIGSGNETMEHLAKIMPETLQFEPASELDNAQLRLNISYAPAPECDLVFAGAKQKVFNLFGQHGLDLVSEINQQIQRHSSEHRLLSVLPSTGEEMASRALMAQSDAALEADALRKADVVSVRRLGLSLMLRDMESYSRDLRPKEWRTIRENFYRLVQRHMLTATGYFDFLGSLPRILGLMVSCRDYASALLLVERILSVRDLLVETTSAGTEDSDAFELSQALLKKGLAQAAVQATTVAHFRWGKGPIELARKLDKIHANSPLPRSVERFKRLSRELLHIDVGRRPYRELWLTKASRSMKNPTVPAGIEIRKLLRLGAVRAFRKAADLKIPYWPGIVFPTRPVSLSEITQAAPSLLTRPKELRDALFAMRGAKARSHEGVVLVPGVQDEPHTLQVDGQFKPSFRFAIPSFLTTYAEWEAALAGSPSLTLIRYVRIRRIINGIMQESNPVDYVVFPECSIPSQWVGTLAHKLASRRISLIAGLEYTITPEGVRNDAYQSIATDWGWHKTSVIYVQQKLAPAYEEKREFRKQHKKLANPNPFFTRPTIIQHDSLSYAVLICSDLTNMAHRYHLQGRIDALVVVEWNKDTETFGLLVESAANDLHAYILQSNNREYGDSRVRAPRKQSYERDIVRVRGGSEDYFVVADLDVKALRQFQSSTPTSSRGPFKPVPIGFLMAKQRGGKAPKKRSEGVEVLAFKGAKVAPSLGE